MVLSVEFLEVVGFYDFYEFRGIIGVGGIAALLEFSCPPFVVGDFQLEKRRIAFAAQEFGMVGKALLHARVFAVFVGAARF